MFWRRYPLRTTGSRECVPDDRLRERFHSLFVWRDGLLHRIAPRNDRPLSAAKPIDSARAARWGFAKDQPTRLKFSLDIATCHSALLKAPYTQVLRIRYEGTIHNVKNDRAARDTLKCQRNSVWLDVNNSSPHRCCCAVWR